MDPIFNGIFQWLDIPGLRAAALPVVTLLSFAVILYLGNRNRSLERRLSRLDIKNSADSSRIALLKTYMRPHFIFNVMAAIQHLILNGDKKEAVRYFSILAGYMRISLEQNMQYTVPYARLVHLLGQYLALENLRYEKEIRLWFCTRDIPEEGQVEYPYFQIQDVVRRMINDKDRINGFELQSICILIRKAGKEVIIRFLPEGKLPDTIKKFRQGNGFLDNFDQYPPDTYQSDHPEIRFSA